jgi:hypothetical protein
LDELAYIGPYYRVLKIKFKSLRDAMFSFSSFWYWQNTVLSKPFETEPLVTPELARTTLYLNRITVMKNLADLLFAIFSPIRFDDGYFFIILRTQNGCCSGRLREDSH